MERIQASDVHGHYGRYDGGHAVANAGMSGDMQTITDRAKRSDVELTFVSSMLGFFPRGQGDSVSANRETAENIVKYPNLRQWVIIDPRKPATFDQAKELLHERTCVGIKIHPEEHVYPIREYGQAIFEFAARFKAIVLTHSGEANSLPEDFLPFADRFGEVTLILAHLGCGYDRDPTHQVRAIQASRNGNVYLDTSSASNITPGLVEWAVKEIGAERMLFGTDTPLYFLPMQRARIDWAEIGESDKKKILRENAEILFQNKI